MNASAYAEPAPMCACTAVPQVNRPHGFQDDPPWLQALTEEELVQVLMQPRNALGRQFAYQFELSGTKLHITEGAQRAIAALVGLLFHRIPWTVGSR